MRIFYAESEGISPDFQPITFQVRVMFNQAFKSIYAMVPGDIMLLLILIPSMLTALSVVREKELGSIANFYAAPATRLEFLLGKQLPYLAVALIQFATLVALAILLFQVPLKGSWATLVLGGTIYLMASTGFGLLISVLQARKRRRSLPLPSSPFSPRRNSPECSCRCLLSGAARG